MKTTDNASYYKRFDYTDKVQAVLDFIKDKKDIKLIFDCGCNNGDVSYPLQKKYGKKVFGIDLAENLDIPKDYNFTKADILAYQGNVQSDSTIFLSLYHHILGKYGLEIVDDLFYRLFFNTKYLIFDSGNMTEKARFKTYWQKAQREVFEKASDLLDHFGLSYKKIGEYKVAGGIRKVVVFYNDKNIEATELKKLKRKVGSDLAQEGLFDFNTGEEILKDRESFYDGTVYHKLKIGNRLFFAKKHTRLKENEKEIANTIAAYEKLTPDQSIKFFGYNVKYGLIFEWLDNFKYIGRTKFTLGNGDMLNDVDIIKVNGKEKFIDFHW